MGKKNETKKKFYFQVVKSELFMGSTLEMLDLSTRSHNVLRRAGISTVGELVYVLENIGKEDNLHWLGKNLGQTSANEIMMALWEYNLICLGKSKMVSYLKETFDSQNDPEFRTSWADEVNAEQWCRDWVADAKKKSEKARAEVVSKRLSNLE